MDRSIPYVDVMMHRKPGRAIPDAPLPQGFRFVLFQQGDEDAWAKLTTSVGEFKRYDEARAYFAERYLSLKPELLRRCLFIENTDGEKVATLTNWWEYTGLRRMPWLHWVSVRPDCQALGLGKAIVSEGLRQMIKIEGDCDIYLHTQTWSYKAINIYRRFGFEITAERGLGGCENADYGRAMELLAPYLR